MGYCSPKIVNDRWGITVLIGQAEPVIKTLTVPNDQTAAGKRVVLEALLHHPGKTMNSCSPPSYPLFFLLRLVLSLAEYMS